VSRPRPQCPKAQWTRGQALKCAKRWGQRAYECPICFAWHCSKQDRSDRVHEGASEYMRRRYYK